MCLAPPTTRVIQNLTEDREPTSPSPYIACGGQFPPSSYMETCQTAIRRIRSAFPPKCTWTGFKGVRPNPWFGRTPSSAGPTLPPLPTILIWYTAWLALVLVRRCRGFVGRFGLSSGPLLHVLRRTRSFAALSAYSSCFLLIPDLCS